MIENSFSRTLIAPGIISLALIGAVGYLLGLDALFLVVILSVLEITLSFDNAVVNARVLRRMSSLWQKRFLTWGILFAVVGTRFILPIIIVCTAAWVSPLTVLSLAVHDPRSYGAMLESVHGAISAFGGMFLLMVALKYFFDHAKSVHWIEVVERHLSRWGRIEAIEIAIALSVLAIVSHFTHADQSTVLFSGIVGLILFIVMEGVTGSVSVESDMVSTSGITLFVYLNLLDAAFSLDGVVGAFALTSELVVIMVGLGIGAYFVRSLTLYLVREGTLDKLVYLEHGAHWAIAGLAFAMILNLVVHVPEVLTGLVGLCFLLFAYRSSRNELRIAR